MRVDEGVGAQIEQGAHAFGLPFDEPELDRARDPEGGQCGGERAGIRGLAEHEEASEHGGWVVGCRERP
ncbi:hypothetical protein GCM10025869_25050 [Homoserinibacter gongjuensis]|uniref:Uncharacterized protein n=1 Tax=Homoserinibacter gongjuensis TaxID=1162968 RepID=A0ABQ6JUK7_9MICO|nr:hypothetical protein GCM10025869_25050 [Homoserinibacter gongjuensis]